jgi:hypothetical protein
MGRHRRDGQGGNQRLTTPQTVRQIGPPALFRGSWRAFLCLQDVYVRLLCSAGKAPGNSLVTDAC